MAVFKNKASQKVACFAYDSTDGSAKTGDAANITAQISKDGAATAATDDTNPTELDATDAPGVYLFDLTQAETNADLVVIAPVSSTGDILIEPLIIYTQPEERSADVTKWGGTATASAISAANLAKLEDILDGTGGVDVEFGQITASCSVANQGALHLINSDVDGSGLYAGGGGSAGIVAIGSEWGMYLNGANLKDLYLATGSFVSLNGGIDPAGIANENELAKVPKSDGSVSWNATALAAINAQADTALSDYGPNTVVPDAAGTAAGLHSTTDAAIAAIPAATEAMMLDEGDASALLAAIAAKVEEFLVNEGDATATIAAIATACNSAITAAHGTGSYLSATGFSTHDAADVLAALGNGSWATEAGGTGDQFTGLPEVTTDAESRTASKADVSGLATIDGKVDTLDTLVDRIAVPCIGNVTGAGTGTEVFVYGDITATVTVDEDGNRSLAWS